MIDFNNNIYLGVASPNMERDLSNYYTKAQTRALVDTKQDIITGAASTITDSNLTANRAVISNGSGKVAVSNVTSTELGYLSGVTSEVQTQLNNKTSTSLDNLTADGQMIVDSQNGTISNCVLEIPQNLKLELNNGILTVKQGSVLVMSGSSTYTTTTVNADRTKDFSSYQDGKIVVLANIIGGLGLDGLLNRVGSGSSLPADNTTYSWFYLTTNYSIYHYESSGWAKKDASYPLCLLEKDSSGVRFAKDSNGNDMIFNGAGFIGHHAFVYPNVKALISDRFNDDGSLKSISRINNGLRITELYNFQNHGAVFLTNWSTYILANAYDGTVDNIENLPTNGHYCYVKTDNAVSQNNNGTITENVNITPLVFYTYDGTTVTDFTIRQPVRTATVEMLNSGGNYISSVTAYSNISRKIKDRFADVINVKDFGAVGDGVTDDSPAFALVEALNNQDVYVPDGAYKINRYTPANITKNYFGSGELLFGNSRENPLVKQVNPITDASAPIKSVNRSVVFIGDSITSGFGDPAGPTVSYVDMLQQKIATVSNVPTCNRASFCNLDYETKTGTWTRGTAGPLERSIILSAGAAISFTANYVDLIQVFYKRSANTTDLTIACNKPAFSETLTTTTGTSIARLEPSEYIRSKEQATITITNSGSNDIELTGIGLYTEAYTGTVYFHNFSCPGYTTANFAKESVINAIVGQTFNNGNAPIFIIELGTNDCYGGLVSPSDFKSNMEYIVSGLLTKAPTAGIVLCQPWLKDGYGATLGTPRQYRNALNAVAVKYGCTVFDGAELDLNRYNSILRADNLHPSPDGYKLLTSWFWEKLKLNSWTQPEISTGITVETGFSSGGDARIKIKNKRAYLNGHIDLGSSTNIANDTAIFSVPKKFAPKNKKYFSTSSSGSIGVVNLYMDTNGIMKIGGKSETNIRFIFIEGISWSMEH